MVPEHIQKILNDYKIAKKNLQDIEDAERKKRGMSLEDELDRAIRAMNTLEKTCPSGHIEDLYTLAYKVTSNTLTNYNYGNVTGDHRLALDHRFICTIYEFLDAKSNMELIPILGEIIYLAHLLGRRLPYPDRLTPREN